MNCPYNLVGRGVLDVPQTTKTWEYNDSTWSDLLTNFNGESITYDEIGNPLTIGSKELSWTGRQLQSITDGDSEIAYTYNGDGLRTSKTVNDVTTEYYYNGSTHAGQKSGNDTLVFMYDNNSDIFGVICNDTEYYYIKNAQNDVIAIADKDGNVLVKYTYDAWGKVIAVTDKDGNPIDDSVGNGVLDVPSNTAEPTTADETATVDESVSLTTVDPQIAQIAHLNPILYRSYYYDKETEWYYLNTRYYSPNMCRFINADGIIQTGQSLLDKNMFAYCLNNPVARIDSNGNFSIAVAIALGVIAICVIAGGVIGGMRKTSAYKQAYSNSQNNNTNSQNKHSNSNNKTSNGNNKKSSSQKSKNNSNKQNYSKGTYETNEKLKPQEIAMNVFIGATVGLAVGGALVALGGVACSVYLGTAAAYGTISLAALATSRQVAAIGILAFNLEAMVFGPFYFAELEPIEWQND